MNSGYVKSYRSKWDHPIFRNKQEAAVWAWMCDTAQWQDTRLSTKFGPIELKRGELLIAERAIAEDFGMHRNTVRNLLRKMSDDMMIVLFQDRTPHRAGTVVKIQNYDQYQGVESRQEEAQDRKPTVNGTEAGPKKDRRGTKNKEDNEVKEGKKEGVGVAVPAPAVADAAPVNVLPFPTQADQTAAKPVKGARLPDDWTLPPEWEAEAFEIGLSPEETKREAMKFHGYWAAKSGADARKANWKLTWRNWCLKAVEYREERARPSRVVNGRYQSHAAGEEPWRTNPSAYNDIRNPPPWPDAPRGQRCGRWYKTSTCWAMT